MVDGGECQLMSRNGHPFKQWDTLKHDIVAILRGRSAILDGELACLAPDGRARFHRLMFRREAPFSWRSICSNSMVRICASRR